MLELKSAETHKIPGRGTIKIVEADRETRPRIRAAHRSQEPVSIDDEQWIIVSIEERSDAPEIKPMDLGVVRATP